MSSLISGLASTNFLNNASQRVLSQSNNVSYSTRGVYRVSDTDPSRKADYWFRDFGMVVACAYMMEFGFKGVDSLYTIPLITEALKLSKISDLKDAAGENRYPNAINYKTLPDVYRNRVMGSLIRSSSSDLVPKLMKQLELNNSEDVKKVPEEIKKDVQAILESKSATEADALVQKHLTAHGLNLKDIQSISSIENLSRRGPKLNKLLAGHTEDQQKAIKNAVRLEDARQMRILIEHLHSNMNFSEYVKDNFLNTKSGLSDTVNDVLKSFSEKVNELRDPAKTSDKLAETLNEIWYLPPQKRAEQFNKKFAEFQKNLFFSEGKPMATQAERESFAKLGEQYRDLLKSDNKAGLQGIVKGFHAFYEDLQLPESQKNHVDQLHSHFGSELRDKIKSKVQDTVKEVIKKDPSKDPTTALTEKLNKLQLEHFLPDQKVGVEEFIGKIRDTLAAAPTDKISKEAKEISKETMDKVNKDLTDLIAKFPKAADGKFHELLNPLLNEANQNLSKEGIKHLISEGISSKAVLNTIKHVQTSSTWPKTFSTVLLNLVFYGFLASNFDNKILQPYQQKLVAERGTSQDIVNAGYLGLIPGFAVVTQLIDQTTLPFIKKMGNFTRFAVVGGVALSTFAGSTYLILQQLLKTPPKNPPKPQAAMPPQPGHSPFAPVLGASNASPFVLPGQPVGGFGQPSFASQNAFQPTANSMTPGFNAQRFAGKLPREFTTRQG